MMRRISPAAAFLTAAVASASWAPAQETDKSGYWLFNPTPRELMREMSADRPDATESPISVDAGHVQVEASFFEFGYDDEDGQRTQSWTIMDTNVKLGLTNNTDIQFVFGAYNIEEAYVPDDADGRLDGFSDVTVRLKMNLWGNEGDTRTAFGIMPFVTIPTGTEVSTEECEGGFIAMLAWNVAENWGLGFMAEVDAVHDPDDDSYDAEFVHTAVLGFDVIGPLGAYVEYLGIASADADTDYQAFFSGGLTYAVTADFQLDAGVRIGMTDAAQDVAVFTGFTFRY